MRTLLIATTTMLFALSGASDELGAVIFRAHATPAVLNAHTVPASGGFTAWMFTVRDSFVTHALALHLDLVGTPWLRSNKAVR